MQVDIPDYLPHSRYILCTSGSKGNDVFLKFNTKLAKSTVKWYILFSRLIFLSLWVKSYPCNRPWRPKMLWDVEAPVFSRQSAHTWRWGCHPYAPASLYPQGRFLVLISVTAWVDPRTIMLLKGLGQLKNQMTSSRIEPSTFRLVA
jgi:hypothetical protein